VKSLWGDGEREREVELASLGGGRFRVRVDDAEFELAVESLEDGRLKLTGESGTTIAEVTAAGTQRFVRLGTLDFVVERKSAARRRGAAHDGGLEAPMPGVVTRVLVRPGDAVKKGQPLLAIEAMKMEHVLRAPAAGRVTKVAAAVGEMVQPGVPLAEVGPESGA
jgi:3-methylcrotonyl-CoA carboxylase alpha subunit